ncbi:MAG: hypothetical protein H0X36_15470, partial [Sphingomonadaceae bacterium]|nr:hypothetical protein [Sphingomonadaceae bacterium]
TALQQLNAIILPKSASAWNTSGSVVFAREDLRRNFNPDKGDSRRVNTSAPPATDKGDSRRVTDFMSVVLRTLGLAK